MLCGIDLRLDVNPFLDCADVECHFHAPGSDALKFHGLMILLREARSSDRNVVDAIGDVKGKFADCVGIHDLVHRLAIFACRGLHVDAGMGHDCLAGVSDYTGQLARLREQWRL